MIILTNILFFSEPKKIHRSVIYLYKLKYIFNFISREIYIVCVLNQKGTFIILPLIP